MHGLPDIRDIAGPLHIDPWWYWPLVVALMLVAAGLGLLLARWWTRRQRPPLSAVERALAGLAQARPLAEAGRPREYAAAASDAVRAYIEAQFGLAAARATTEEFLEQAAAESSPIPLAERRELARFLQSCDLAKFARFAFARDEMAGLHDAALRFVLATTRPQPEEASS